MSFWTNESRCGHPFGKTSSYAALQLKEPLFVIIPAVFSAMLASSSSV